MPLPSDEKILALSAHSIQQFHEMFGTHPGFRPAHAKGVLLTGSFTPTAAAALLTKAPHATRKSTPVLVRFSNSTGLPLVPDTDPNANPRGMAIRFQLAEHVHTDIVAHSTDGFPTRTGVEFLEFLKALAASGPHLEAFLDAHPAALRFVQTPKPAPVSFATEAYFGVTAMQFTNAEGHRLYGRYRIVPGAGLDHLDDAMIKAKQPNYLFDEIIHRAKAKPVNFQVQVQTAFASDVVDDATVQWPEDRPLHAFGEIVLTGVLPDQEAEQKQIIFDPIPRIEGIEPSADPLLELRAAIYLISGRRRRAD